MTQFNSEAQTGSLLRQLVHQLRGLDRMRKLSIERRDAAARTAIAMEAAIDNHLARIKACLAGPEIQILSLPGGASALVLPPQMPGDLLTVEVNDERGNFERIFGI